MSLSFLSESKAANLLCKDYNSPSLIQLSFSCFPFLLSFFVFCFPSLMKKASHHNVTPDIDAVECSILQLSNPTFAVKSVLIRHHKIGTQDVYCPIGGQFILRPLYISVKAVNRMQDTSSGQQSCMRSAVDKTWSTFQNKFILNIDPNFGSPK